MFAKIYKEVMSKLENNLPSWLHYHSPAHTQYVLDKAIFLAEQEGVDGRDLFLIKVAALYHDLGFIENMENHEERGCRMAAQELPEYGLSQEETSKICDMIMATRIPQQPNTTLEKVLADADLEYLGTDKYDEISEQLYKELLHSRPDLTRAQWNEIQVKFLCSHSFHTSYCKIHCEAKKAEHLEALREKLTSEK
ncbi:HD domain-containing protein [Salinimicrobium oceani]|uniref:HD domain-containing protein n=1 Tax=Salinimicrobium oceani TaxID=2722702 RepID=UPI00143B1040|nr:HD domain-containing protein [Salinimicrobium oceani]